MDHLDDIGALRVPPFDTSACDGATLANLSRKRIDWFLETARRERGFPLKSNTTTQALLTQGIRGPGVHYVLTKRKDIKGTLGT